MRHCLIQTVNLFLITRLIIRLWNALDNLEHGQNLPVEDFCTKEDFPTQKENRSVNGDYLWKVSRDDIQHPFYLFGTLHVEANRLLSLLSDRTKAIYLGSDSVFFEIDFSTLLDINKCEYLPDGKTLENIIPKELLDNLRIHIDWLGKKTGWVLPEHYWKRMVPEHLVFEIYFRRLKLHPKVSSKAEEEPNQSTYKKETRKPCVADDLVLDQYLFEFAKGWVENEVDMSV